MNPMKTPTQLPVLVSFCLLFMCSNINSQDTKDATILYNSQPVEVQLSDAGRILAFYGIVPNYMEGYELGPAKSVQQPIAASADIDPTFTSDSQNANYDVVSRERVDLSFPSDFATLSKETIASLNEVSQLIRTSQYAKVLLTAYDFGNGPQKLIQNRLNSVVAYLNIKGLSSEQIITEVRQSDALADTVTINFIQ